MNTDTYKRSYVEVLEILNHIPETEYEKIPKEKIEFFYNNRDTDYKFIFDPEKMNVSRKAYAIIINLYKDYIANDNQKQIVENALKHNSNQMELAKREKYNVDNIFKTNNSESKNHSDFSDENIIENQKALIEINEEKKSFWNKIMKFIKNFFTRS